MTWRALMFRLLVTLATLAALAATVGADWIC